MTILLLLLALFAFCVWLYFSCRSATGLPPGLLVDDDAGRQHPQRPLVLRRLRLLGRPDYLIETTEGLVPVELKSGACPRSRPHAARVAQLMTYYVLVEDTLACPVLYGVMQYSDAQRQIPFTADRKRFVLQLADEIRRKRGSPNVHRQPATSTHWSLSEVRLPVCERRVLELTELPDATGYTAKCRSSDFEGTTWRLLAHRGFRWFA